MAYSDFNLAKVKKDFHLTLDETRNLFAETQPYPLSENLKSILSDYIILATSIGTEKARSEFLIAPILAETRRLSHNQISLFSGNEFNVDASMGLQGFCDYLISASPEQLFISAPVLIIVEAKKEDIIGGLGQCIAAMIAAQYFNQNQGSEIERIYGVVTSGTNWKFLFIEGTTVYIDLVEYYINQVEKILGILMQSFPKSISKKKD